MTSLTAEGVRTVQLPPGAGSTLLTLSVILALSCGAAPDPYESATRSDQAAAAVVNADTLALQLDAPAEVAPGEPLVITLRVENVSGAPLDLYLRGRTIVFDLVVSRPDGTIVWRRLEDEVVPAILRIERLEPGAFLELSDTWNQRSGAGHRLPPGDYTVHGELLTEGEPLVTRRVPLRIVPA
jgi:hypothetical protein